jgi:hypothetical protein
MCAIIAQVHMQGWTVARSPRRVIVSDIWRTIIGRGGALAFERCGVCLAETEVRSLSCMTGKGVAWSTWPEMDAFTLGGPCTVTRRCKECHRTTSYDAGPWIRRSNRWRVGRLKDKIRFWIEGSSCSKTGADPDYLAYVLGYL